MLKYLRPHLLAYSLASSFSVAIGIDPFRWACSSAFSTDRRNVTCAGVKLAKASAAGPAMANRSIGFMSHKSERAKYLIGVRRHHTKSDDAENKLLILLRHPILRNVPITLHFLPKKVLRLPVRFAMP